MEIHLQKITDLTDKELELVMAKLPLRYEKTLRLKNEADRLRSVAAGILMLKKLPVTDEADIKYGEQGKPYIEGPVRFSLSHSGDYAVLVTSESEVGADIEEISPRALKLRDKAFGGPESEFIMNCADGELKALLEFEYSASISPEARGTLIWTRRESIMKAFGEGLAMYKEIEDTGLRTQGVTTLRGRTCHVTSLLIENYFLSICEIIK